jgi:hypothetical protein
MPNVFDRFDAAPAPKAGANPFDQFDGEYDWQAEEAKAAGLPAVATPIGEAATTEVVPYTDAQFGELLANNGLNTSPRSIIPNMTDNLRFGGQTSVYELGTAAAPQRLDRSMGQLGTDLGMTFKQSAREGVLGLAEAPVSAINALNSGLNLGADALAGVFGGDAGPGVPMMSQPEVLQRMRAATEAQGDELYRRDASATLRYDDANRPDTFRGTLGYAVENPGSLLTDVSRTGGAMLPGIIPGSAGASIALQSVQQAQQSANEVEQALLAKGVDPQSAKAQAAEAFATATGIGLVAPKLVPGGQAFEDLITGTAQRGTGSAIARVAAPLIGEPISEGIEEGGIKAAQNVYSGDPIGQGVGGAVASGSILGLGMGAAPAAIEAVDAIRNPAPVQPVRTALDGNATPALNIEQFLLGNAVATPTAPPVVAGGVGAPVAPPLGQPVVNAPVTPPVAQLEQPTPPVQEIARVQEPQVIPEADDAGVARAVAGLTEAEAAQAPEAAVAAETQAASQESTQEQVAEPAAQQSPAARLYADYSPDESQTVRASEGALSWPESKLTRRAVDDALSDPDPVAGAERLLTNISQQPDVTPAEKWLAEKLAPMMRPLGIKLGKADQNYKYGGGFNNIENTLWVRQANPETALHESFHGVTSALITNKAARSNPVVGKAVAELDDMLGSLQGSMLELDTRGLDPEIQRVLNDKQGPLSNTRELVTYGMTNRPFQDFLKSLPPPPGRTEARNMWEYFKSIVTSLFGKTTPSQRSFLDALIETGADLAEFAAANPKVARQAQMAEAAKLAPVSELPVARPAPPAAQSKPAPPSPASPQGADSPPVETARAASDTPPSRPLTSTKNAVVEGERERAGKEPVKRDAPRSNETTLEMAKAAIADNPDLPAELIARLSVSGVASINSVEEAALLVESERLRAARDRAGERASDESLSDEVRATASAKWAELEGQIDAIDQATVNSGREWGRFGQMRQRMIKADYTLAALEKKARAVKGGPLTAAESAEIKTMADTIARQQADLDAVRKQLEEFETGAAVEQTYKRLLEDIKKSARMKPDIAALKKKADAAKAALRELAGVDAATLRDYDSKAFGKAVAAAQKAYESLSNEAQLSLSEWQFGGWDNGRLASAELNKSGAYQEIRTAFEPVREILRAEFGDKIPVFRGVRRGGKGRDGRVLYSWTASPSVAKRFAENERYPALQPPTKSEIGAAVSEYERTGFVSFRGKKYKKNKENPRYYDIYGRNNSYITDGENIRAEFEGLAKERTENNIERETRGDVLSKTVSPSEIEWLFSLSQEFIVNDRPTAIDAATLSPQQALIDLGKYHYANGSTDIEAWTAAMEADVPEQFRKGLADLFELSKLGAAKPVLEGPLTHKQVYDLALANVRSGVKGEDAVMAAVTKDVQVEHPEMTERDVRRLFSEYGKAYFPSKDADKTALRELRALVQMQESIDRLEEGLPKLKNGLQRDKATAAVIAKRAELNELLKAQSKKTRDAERLAAIERARIKNLTKQIELLDKQVMTGERNVKAAAKPMSAEVARLSALRDQLRAELKAIDNPPLTPDERYQKTRASSLKRELEKIQARIAAGDYEKAVRTPKTLNAANEQAAFELQKAKEVFLRKQFEWEQAKRTKLEKLADIGKDIMALPQPLMTSLDLSALLRQGGVIAAARPTIAIKAIPTMLRAFRSEQAAHAAEERIKNSPNYELMKLGGLELTTDNPLAKLSDMEEKFRSRWIEKFAPKEGETAKNAVRGAKNVLTAHVRASNRAFVSTLNAMRAMSFDAMLKTWTRDPANPTLAELKAISRYINIATGRGEIPGSKGQGPGFIANAAIFAPRLLASRFNLLYGLPYAGGTARTKAMVAAEYARIWAGAAVVVALGRMLWELQDDEDKENEFIGTDPRSTNFGKMRFGNAYVDPLAGFAQTTTFLARIITGEQTLQSGDVVPLRQNYRPLNLLRDEPVFDKPTFGMRDAAGEFGRFLRTKLAPWPGAVISLASGKDPVGNEVTPVSTAIGLVSPLSAGDIIEIMEANGIAKATALTMAAIFGMGVQNRDPASRAAGFDEMTRADKDIYGEYEVAANKLKVAKKDLQEFANSLPDDLTPYQARAQIEAKADELGIEGATASIYKRNTTARNEDGSKKRGLARTEAGAVKLDYRKAYAIQALNDAEKAILAIDKQIEKVQEGQVINSELSEIWGKYQSGELPGNPDEKASKANREKVLKTLNDERRYQQELFVEAQDG